MLLEQFKRGGKGFSFSEWGSLSAADQAIAIEVQRDLDMEQAALVAYFMMNPKEMLERLGGEDAVVRAALEGRIK
jgi:1,2-phenylacetyl-CoA epoxidase PaaB subunit